MIAQIVLTYYFHTHNEPVYGIIFGSLFAVNVACLGLKMLIMAAKKL